MNKSDQENISSDDEMEEGFTTENFGTVLAPDTDNTNTFGKGGAWYSLINIEPSGVAVFFRQIATLIGAGMPMLNALRTITKSSDTSIRKVVNSIANGVERGEALSYAMSKFPKIFSKVYLNLIIVAEKGGALEETLMGIANLAESDDKTRMQIKRALLYPAVTLCLAIGVLIFVLSYVIPKFVSTILGSAENLSVVAKVMVNTADFFNNYWWLILFGSSALCVFAYLSAKQPAGKCFWDSFTLRVPVFGVIMRKVLTMHFCRSFGMLIRNGVPVLEAFRLLSETTDNEVFAGIFRKTCIALENGSSIVEPIASSNMFSPFVIDLITTGESSGQLDMMMIKIADAYNDEIKQVTQNLGTLVEPILLLIIGAFVSLIVFSVFSTYVQTLKMLS